MTRTYYLISFLAVAIAGAFFYRAGTAAIAFNDDDNRLTELVAAAAEAHAYTFLDRHAETYTVSSTTPQFVLFSFDGSRKVSTLEDIANFQSFMQRTGKPVHFTFFANAAHFIPDMEATTTYAGPHHAPGKSEVGFGGTRDEIARRVELFRQMMKGGTELASHTVGHFHDADWSAEDWGNELGSFTRIMSQYFPMRQVTGFRAPHLEDNAAMYRVLPAFGYIYDSSPVSRNAGNWPFRDTNGLWEIPLGMMKIGPYQTPVIAMDYNIWMHQSQAQEVAVRGTPLWKQYFDETLDGYRGYFRDNYEGSRAPIMIANHVSRWNDGVYWQAMQAFASEVCGLPNVRCGTYQELVSYLNQYGTPAIK